MLPPLAAAQRNDSFKRSSEEANSISFAILNYTYRDNLLFIEPIMDE